MDFLKNLYIISEAGNSKKDLSVLEDDVIKEIKKNIRDGAADLDRDWANALELVHEAYRVAGVERPTPAERAAWKQYEEMLQYAVEQLYEHRKLANSDWRMSSTVFKEAMERRVKIRVFEIGDKFAKGHTVEAQNIEEVIKMIRKQAGQKSFDMEVEQHDPSSCTCYFSYQGIRKPYHIKIQQL